MFHLLCLLVVLHHFNKPTTTSTRLFYQPPTSDRDTVTLTNMVPDSKSNFGGQQRETGCLWGGVRVCWAAALVISGLHCAWPMGICRSSG